jgi:hypothetical protein
MASLPTAPGPAGPGGGEGVEHNSGSGHAVGSVAGLAGPGHVIKQQVPDALGQVMHRPPRAGRGGSAGPVRVDQRQPPAQPIVVSGLLPGGQPVPAMNRTRQLFGHRRPAGPPGRGTRTRTTQRWPRMLGQPRCLRLAGGNARFRVGGRRRTGGAREAGTAQRLGTTIRPASWPGAVRLRRTSRAGRLVAGWGVGVDWGLGGGRGLGGGDAHVPWGRDAGGDVQGGDGGMAAGRPGSCFAARQRLLAAACAARCPARRRRSGGRGSRRRRG